MKAIFLCDNQDIFGIYDAKITAELQMHNDIEKKVYSKDDVLRNPILFSETEFIFSTWGMPKFTKDEIRLCFPSLKCLFYAAGTVQYFVKPFLECGVKVFSAWAANAIPVAEVTTAQIILSNKGYFITNRIYRQRGMGDARKALQKCNGNFNETVGIIGAGMIGKLVIQMLKNYDLKIIVYDPFLSEETANELNVEKCDLKTLFEHAFVVSNHMANNEQTKGLLNYSLFSRMRENAVFINTGRGAQVVEDDLVRILNERPDLTALLDVTFPEPPDNNHPFYTLSNCLMTPHIAGSEGSEVARMGLYMLREYLAYTNGEVCKYEVTAKMLETMA